ncbi:MAG: 4-alpha-glucanotransferase [Candidatus Aureabacteria bacterium]|nr:4-alpha-glucanotransferase [Candidatus Auribacterota bacterium]
MTKTIESAGLKNQLMKQFGKNHISGTFMPLFYARDEDDFGIGDIGSLIKAVELSAHLGHHVLEILPINFSSAFESPYSVLSTKCFNTIYINIPMLFNLIPSSDAEKHIESRQEEVTLVRSLFKVDYAKVRKLKNGIYEKFYDTFNQSNDKRLRNDFSQFKKQHEGWLKDHLLFILLRNKYCAEIPGRGWDFRSWPENVRCREAKTLHSLMKEYESALDYEMFLQWIFYTQWKDLQKKAKEKNVALMGDIPFAVDGADIWIQPGIFGLKAPEFRRTFTQGVPPDCFSQFGQYWQFYPYDWKNPETIQFLMDRLEWNFGLFSINRLDHVLGYYRSYLFFEDPEDTATFQGIKIWNKMHGLILQAKNDQNIHRGNIVWKAYRVLLRAMKHKRLAFYPDIIEDLFSDDDEYLLKENNMILVSKKARGNQAPYGWQRQFCVEDAIFDNTPFRDFQKISNDSGYQDHERLSGYLFDEGGMGIAPDDSIHPCFFKSAPGEELIHSLLKLGEKNNSILIMEALGIVPQWITDSLSRIGAINYIPLIYGMTPQDAGNPYFTPNHLENAFVTFALHDSETLSEWWNKKSAHDRQVILDYLFGKDVEKAEHHETMDYGLQKAMLSEVYKSKARIKVLLWTDIFLSDSEFTINKPGAATGQWISRMPMDATLDDLIRAAEGKSSTLISEQAIKLLRELEKPAVSQVIGNSSL